MSTSFKQDPNASSAGGAPAVLTLILGLWYVVSPWVYGGGHSTNGATWNSVVVGVLIALFAAARLSNRVAMPAARWLDLVLGLWAALSPWIFGYVGNQGWLINSLAVGVCVFVLSLWGTGTSRPTVIRAR
jgi:hypothetical protein